MVPHGVAGLLVSILLSLLVLPSAGSRARRQSFSADGQDGGPLSDKTTKRIKAVNATLKDLLQSIQNEQAKEEKAYGELMKWCKSEVKGFSGLIKDTTTEAEKMQVAQQEYNASIEKFEHEYERLKKDISTAEDEIVQAKRLQGKTDAKNQEDMDSNLQSLNQVKKAISITSKVGEAGGFLQNGRMRRLQINSPGEVSYVTGVMEGLKEKFLRTRKELTKAHDVATKATNALLGAKTLQIKAFSKERSGKREAAVQARLKLVEVNRRLKRAQEKLPKLKDSQYETDSFCWNKRGSWKMRSEDRVNEMLAIKQAIRLMSTLAPTQALVESKAEVEPATETETSSDGDSFVQTGERHRRVSNMLGAKALAALASMASRGGGGFDSVRKVIQDMVDILNKDQAEEEKLTKKCRQQLDAKSSELQDTQDELKKLTASLSFRKTEQKTLAAEVKEINATITKLGVQLEKAAKLRKKETRRYLAASKDRKLALRVLKQAVQVIESFYATNDPMLATNDPMLANNYPMLVAEKAAFTPSMEKPKSWGQGSSRHDVAGSAVVGLLERVADGLRNEQEAADGDEQMSASAYEKLKEESREEFDDNLQEFRTRMQKLGRLKVVLVNDGEDATVRQKEATDLGKVLKSVHAQCDKVMKELPERTESRNFQLSQLKDVMDILAGAQVAVRTGLVQKPRTASS